MRRLGDALRVAIVAGAALAALGSSTKRPLQASYFTKAQPPSHACEDACAQVSACDLTPYPACLSKCRADGTEQQAGGPERLAVIARSSCDDIAATTQPGQAKQPPLPAFEDSAIPPAPAPTPTPAK